MDNHKQRTRRGPLAALLACAMALCIALPATAFAAGGGSTISDASANWSIPNTPMTDTIQKDGKTYKVVTTWAMAWSTSGPDFLGINNASFYGNGGNGNANVTSSEIGSKSSLLGIWASSANEEPNAFNWNSFYNLYADEQAKVGNNLAKSDQACTTAAWDTESGVYGPFKYRPEVIWLCNNLSASQTATYVDYINKGQYVSNVSGAKDKETITEDAYKALSADEQKNYTAVSSGQGRNATTVYCKLTWTNDASQYAVDGDATYNPAIIQPVCSTPFSFVESGYELATIADQVIANTANNSQAAASNLNWKTMNNLPRSNRYAETPQQCALYIEEYLRGSIYYTLSKINDGTVDRKKVAYVVGAPGSTVSVGNASSQTVVWDGTTDTTHAIVAVFDFIDDINGAGENGVVSTTPLTVEQLGANGEGELLEGYDHVEMAGNVSTADSGSANTAINRSYATYSYYKVDADALAGCDVIYGSRGGTYTPADYKTFISTNATTSALKAKADKLSYITGFPYVCNGSNYTMDKLVYAGFGLDCIYPELFPNMENLTFWYNKIYHIKADSLGDALSWATGVATLPSGTSLLSASEAKSYDADATRTKYYRGLKYYNENKTKDATIVRVLANKALNGSTTLTTTSGTANNAYLYFEPSNTFLKSDFKVADEVVTAAKNVTVNKDTGVATVKAKKLTKKAVKAAVAAGATKFTLNAKCTTIAANAFKGTKVKQVTIKAKNIKPKNVKNAFKGSKVKTVKVPKASLTKYKTKVFIKSVVGKKVTVKKA